MGLVHFVTCSIHLCVCWSMLAALDYLSHITVFLWLRNMYVIASWKYLSKTLHFLNVMSHCHVLYFWCPNLSFWYFMPVPILCSLFFCYPFLMFECCHFLHIMVMVDCLIDSYLWICVSLCSIALSPVCCTYLIVHFSIDCVFVWVWPILSLYLCKKYLVYTLICI